MRGFTIGTIITIGSGNQPDTPGESDISGRSDAQRQCSASPGKALIDDPEEQLSLSGVLYMPDDTDAAYTALAMIQRTGGPGRITDELAAIRRGLGMISRLLFCVEGGLVPENGYVYSLPNTQFIEYPAHCLFDRVPLNTQPVRDLGVGQAFADQ